MQQASSSANSSRQQRNNHNSLPNFNYTRVSQLRDPVTPYRSLIDPSVHRTFDMSFLQPSDCENIAFRELATSSTENRSNNSLQILTLPERGGRLEAVDDVGGKSDGSQSHTDEDAQDDENEANGVWSAEIEQYFQEALELYPPCGRRKIILAEEGKMYGRNELIARHIQQRTGKVRTRKQVSSHIQVLARRKSKELQSIIRDPEMKKDTLSQLARLSSAQIVSCASGSTSTSAITAATSVAKGIQEYHAVETSRNNNSYNRLHSIGSSSSCGSRKSMHFNNLKQEDVPQPKIMRISDPDVYNPQDSLPLFGNRSPSPLDKNPLKLSFDLLNSSVSAFSTSGFRHSPLSDIASTRNHPNFFSGDVVDSNALSSASSELSSNRRVSDLRVMHLAAQQIPGLEQYLASRSTSAGVTTTTDFFYGQPPPMANSRQNQSNISNFSGFHHSPLSEKPSNKRSATAFSSSACEFSSQVSDTVQIPVEPNMRRWINRSIASEKLRLIELCAFVEYPCPQSAKDTNVNPGCIRLKQHNFAKITANTLHPSDPLLEEVDPSQIWDKFPTACLKQRIESDAPNAFFLVKLWADINTELPDGANYAVSSVFEGLEDIPLRVTTRLCSFSLPFVEKQEDEIPTLENGRYIYKLHRSPMCTCMKKFIDKLMKLSTLAEMNKVLENFTILQIVTNKNTDEILLGIAYVLEVSKSQNGSLHHIYRLAKPSSDHQLQMQNRFNGNRSHHATIR